MIVCYSGKVIVLCEFLIRKIETVAEACKARGSNVSKITAEQYTFFTNFGFRNALLLIICILCPRVRLHCKTSYTVGNLQFPCLYSKRKSSVKCTFDCNRNKKLSASQFIVIFVF